MELANIASATLATGTMGNMGDGSYTSSYARLDVGNDGAKAWKVTGTRGYVYFLAKCGNAFYPDERRTAACINTPVTVTVQPQEIITTGQKNEIISRVFVYYHMKRHHKHPRNLNPNIPDTNPSNPLVLSTTEKTELVPETYKVTIVNPEKNTTVCPDSAAVVSAAINVEKISGYSGFYPGKPNNQYILVKKHVYNKAARKIRKAEKKETKVARITKTLVTIKTGFPGKV